MMSRHLDPEGLLVLMIGPPPTQGRSFPVANTTHNGCAAHLALDPYNLMSRTAPAKSFWRLPNPLDGHQRHQEAANS